MKCEGGKFSMVYEDEEPSTSTEAPSGVQESPTKSEEGSSDDEDDEETGRKRFVKKYS